MMSVQARATLLILIMVCIVAPPVLADVNMGEARTCSAYVAGLNEFTAGSDITIPVVIENSGLNQDQQVNTNIVARDGSSQRPSSSPQ